MPRRRRLRATLLPALVAGLAVACGGAPEPVAGDEGSLVEGKALVADDFTSDLSKGFIEATHTLSAGAFDTKWKASRSKSALMFFRAYPAAYHKDFASNLRPSALAKIPAGSGLCFGDAHPDNFGFLRLEDTTLYAYNDLDDSGHCPVALDALRFVTAVRLYFGKDLAEAAADRYVKVLSGERTIADAKTDVAKLRDERAPDFDARRGDKLGEVVAGDALILGDGVVAASAATRKEVSTAVTRALPGLTVLDVAEVEREAGGSGGLARYWLLVERASSRTVLELKEAAKPGVDHGLDARPMSEATRLSSLEKDLWGITPKGDYFYVKSLGKTLLLRDRMAKASLDLGDLKDKELERAIEAQAGIVAMLHQRALTVANEEEAKTLRRWLEHSSDTLAQRWKKAYE